MPIFFRSEVQADEVSGKLNIPLTLKGKTQGYQVTEDDVLTIYSLEAPFKIDTMAITQYLKHSATVKKLVSSKVVTRNQDFTFNVIASATINGKVAVYNQTFIADITTMQNVLNYRKYPYIEKDEWLWKQNIINPSDTVRVHYDFKDKTNFRQNLSLKFSNLNIPGKRDVTVLYNNPSLSTKNRTKTMLEYYGKDQMIFIQTKGILPDKSKWVFAGISGVPDFASYDPKKSQPQNYIEAEKLGKLESGGRMFTTTQASTDKNPTLFQFDDSGSGSYVSIKKECYIWINLLLLYQYRHPTSSYRPFFMGHFEMMTRQNTDTGLLNIVSRNRMWFDSPSKGLEQQKFIHYLDDYYPFCRLHLRPSTKKVLTTNNEFLVNPYGLTPSTKVDLMIDIKDLAKNPIFLAKKNITIGNIGFNRMSILSDTTFVNTAIFDAGASNNLIENIDPNKIAIKSDYSISTYDVYQENIKKTYISATKQLTPLVGQTTAIGKYYVPNVKDTYKYAQVFPRAIRQSFGARAVLNNLNLYVINSQTNAPLSRGKLSNNKPAPFKNLLFSMNRNRLIDLKFTFPWRYSQTVIAFKEKHEPLTVETPCDISMNNDLLLQINYNLTVSKKPVYVCISSVTLNMSMKSYSTNVLIEAEGWNFEPLSKSYIEDSGVNVLGFLNISNIKNRAMLASKKSNYVFPMLPEPTEDHSLSCLVRVLNVDDAKKFNIKLTDLDRKREDITYELGYYPKFHVDFLLT